MRSFAGRDILSLKDFERNEFFHVFEIADQLEPIARERRNTDLLANVTAGTVFLKGEKVVWRCRNCGYLHEGEEAPEVCPACAHPRAHFEVLGENW